MVKVVITGGVGFLGMEVAKRLLARGTAWSPVAKRMVPITKLALFDSAPSSAIPTQIAADPRVAHVHGSVSEAGWARALVDTPDVGVFHFASMMSGNSEADFDAAWSVNVLAQRDMLEALRAVGSQPRFFFTSSTASLGAEASGDCATDLTKLVPEGTYGFTKSVCELMLNEYSRRGFVDGRGLRLPVVVVRPGAPNAAATGAYSNVVREPLAGKSGSCILPLDLRMPCTSYQVAADNMLTLMELEQEVRTPPSRSRDARRAPRQARPAEPLYSALAAVLRLRRSCISTACTCSLRSRRTAPSCTRPRLRWRRSAVSRSAPSTSASTQWRPRLSEGWPARPTARVRVRSACAVTIAPRASFGCMFATTFEF
jgi:nucleoside-diphosphate-sugar epimerase